MTKRKPQVRRPAFLAAYKKTGNISESAAAARVSRRAHYDWLKERPEYAADFAEAHEEAIEALETEARIRATIGTGEPVIYQGELCFEPARDRITGEVLRNDNGDIIMSDTPLVIYKKSDILLMFVLKALRPEKYRENVTAAKDDVQVNVIINELHAARKRCSMEDRPLLLMPSASELLDVGG